MSDPGKDWQQLPESARAAILHIASLCRSGHTGRIRLEIHQGGVAHVEITEKWRPSRKSGPDPSRTSDSGAP